MKKNIVKLLSLVLLVALLLVACKTDPVEKPPLVYNESTAVALTVSAMSPSHGETDVATPAPEALETQAPVSLDLIQAEILLWAPQSADQGLAQNLDTQLQTYASLNKMAYERQESFAATQLSDDTRLVVSLASADETRMMAEAKALTQFLVFSGAETNP